MNHTNKLPAAVPCQAELITGDDRNSRPGRQCGAESVGEREGRPVCWLHKGAVRQLTFVKAVSIVP